MTKEKARKDLALRHSERVYRTGADPNIYIAHEGAAGESDRIRIGTPGTHTQTFVAGIAGSVIAGSAVLVNTFTHQLGVAPSSVRFKEEIRDLSEESEVLMALRPVSFRYRANVLEGERHREYGLLAEEVSEVAPNLVGYDAEGKPFSVHYRLLTPLLLNEMQKQQRTIATLLARLDAVEAELETAREGANR